MSFLLPRRDDILIRSFPLCNFLFLVDGVTGRRAAGGNVLAGLPKHKLEIKDLQLSSSLSDDLLIDVSNPIEDAALDVGSSEGTRRVAVAVSGSPVEQFQVACAEPRGFQGRHPPLNPER